MRKFLAFILIITIVAPLIAVTIGLLAIDPWILDRDFYTHLLSDKRLYEAILTEELPNQINRQMNISESDPLPVNALGEALRASGAVTPEYLRDQAVMMTNNIFDFFEGKTVAPELILDMMPIKNKLKNDIEAQENFVQTLAKNLPVCTVSQTDTDESAIPTCRVQEGTSAEAKAAAVTATATKIKANLRNAFLDRIKDEISLGDPANMKDAEWFSGVTLRSLLNEALGVLLLVSLLCWFVMGLIAGNSVRERMIWWGLGLLFAAVPCALLGFVLNTATLGGILHVTLSAEMAYSEPFEQAMMGVFSSIIGATGSGLLGFGVVTSAIGVIFIIFGSRMTKPPRKIGPLVEVPLSGRPGQEW
ncbi:MAG TPA: hypothetical protein VHO69_09880 [Phototrophicaceae bacterium]|nr:hypothetical protein [Phototrophicaceae bacterium]